MDKRGFLKIMEAVIAIILVFSVVLYILPKAEKVTFKIPPDLELIAGTILDDAQNDEEFRKCILKNKGEDNYPNCVRTEVERGIGTGTLWQHAEKICELNNNGAEINCMHIANEINTDDETLFLQTLPKDKDVYTKSVTVKVPDITADPPLSTGIVNKQLRIFFWSK